MTSQAHPIPVDLLRELLKLDRNTGKIYWMVRLPKMFSGGAHSKEQEAKRWNGRHAFKEAMTSKTSSGYYGGPLLGRTYKVHQVIFALANGKWPTDQLDHINHDRTDNRPENLREVDASGNAKNHSMRKDNTSGHLGVNFKKSDQKWVARISYNGGRVYLGTFKTIEMAIDARKDAEKEFGYHLNHGDKAA